MVLIVPGKGNADMSARVGFFTYMVLVKVLGAHSGGGLVPPGTWIWCHSGNAGGGGFAIYGAVVSGSVCCSGQSHAGLCPEQS